MLGLNGALIEFHNAHPEVIAENNALPFISSDGGDTYNRCHCELIVFSASYPILI
jgi:hypothetical protein